MDRFPEGAILVTIDTVGLYPHIPHNGGVGAIRKILNMKTNQVIPSDDIVTVLCALPLPHWKVFDNFLTSF